MKIGITERGDAGIDFSWIPMLKTVDGAILITKKMSDAFNKCVMSAEKPVIIHCTCTGWGGTYMESNVQPYEEQLAYLQRLIGMGFPINRVVLRLDPIIPNEEGLRRAENVLEYMCHRSPRYQPEKLRVRFSVVDEYPHIRERLAKAGVSSIYEDVSGMSRYRADVNEKRAVAALLSKYPFAYEACAEDWALRYMKVDCIGCVSRNDMEIMGLSVPGTLWENQQGRKDCHCLTCKTELLSNKKRCPNGCLYCYWHD